jgi:hypothetical protein
MHPQQVRTVFTMEREVLQFQVVQRSETHFDVRVVPFPGANLPALQTRIEAEFRRRFGDEIGADVHIVDSVDRTVGGKFRPVISLCRDTRRQSLNSEARS